MFSKNLKFLREKKNMEQLELAEMLGRKSSSSISEWEKGKYTPRTCLLIWTQKKPPTRKSKGVFVLLDILFQEPRIDSVQQICFFRFRLIDRFNLFDLILLAFNPRWNVLPGLILSGMILYCYCIAYFFSSGGS